MALMERDRGSTELCEPSPGGSKPSRRTSRLARPTSDTSTSGRRCITRRTTWALPAGMIPAIGRTVSNRDRGRHDRVLSLASTDKLVADVLARHDGAQRPAHPHPEIVLGGTYSPQLISETSRRGA